MTATLPSELQDVFERSSSAELVTIDAHGRPAARSVAPSYHHGEVCIDVPLVEPPPSDPLVALLFAQTAPVVLVQGTAKAEGVLHVRPERVFVWPSAGSDDEPRLYDAHLEEVRSGHNEEPEIGHADPEGGAGRWDRRLDGLREAVLACVAPDGFPFAAPVGLEADPDGAVVRIAHVPVGVPVEPGLASLHCPDGSRVQGDLVPGGPGAAWTLVPHAVLDA